MITRQTIPTTPRAPTTSRGHTRVLALFFGTDKKTFTVTTTNAAAPQQTRTYNRFSDAAADVVTPASTRGSTSRFADVQARRQGRHWLSGLLPCLRSIDDDDHDDDDEE